MARDSRRRRRRRGTSIHDLPDELLELVLLRVRTPICLFCAAATCKVWRRVIVGDDGGGGGGGGFLQRVRSLHRPNHLLGHYSVKTTQTKAGRRTDIEFIPFPAARPAAHLRQRLSLDYLMEGKPWQRKTLPDLTDSRGGLLAFVRGNCQAVVCDPWTRQYRVLDFPWAVRGGGDRWWWCLGAFILDAGDDGDGDDKSSLMSSFSVLCVCLNMGYYPMTAEACVFSARENGWIRRTVSGDDVVFTEVEEVDMDQQFVGRAGGSIFFSGFKDDDDHHDHVLLVLDEATGDFSTITLPLLAGYDEVYSERENLRVVNVVNGDDAAPSGTLVRIVRLAKDDLEVLKATRRDQQHGGWDCTVEMRVDLCKLGNIHWSHHLWGFLETIDDDGQMARAPMARRPMTRSFSSAQARRGPTTMSAVPTTAAATTMSAVPTTAAATLQVIGARSTLFSLDVQTLKLQRVKKKMTATLDLNARRVFPYELPWPQTIN